MRKIGVFTGSRSEYGLLKGLCKKIQADKRLELNIFASGTHLSPEFGLTYREIENDGFNIDEKIITLLSSDTPIAVCKSIALGLIGYSEALDRVHPDILVILGDRFESLAMAIAALSARIPVAHIHGGESTFGAVDEAFRHAITKMSHLHFTSTEKYRDRVIQLGETPDNVFNVGALGVENCKKLVLLKQSDIEKKLKCKFGKRTALITFHPETLTGESSEIQFHNLLDALDQFNDIYYIFTKANSDSDGRIINFLIDDYCRIHKDNSFSITSMGQQLYLSTLSLVDLVIGNSSSGIIEAPSLKTPTINIGLRQQGREKAESVIDCNSDTDSIVSAINQGLSSSDKSDKSIFNNPYEREGSSDTIIHILKNISLKKITLKAFHDLPIGS